MTSHAQKTVIDNVVTIEIILGALNETLKSVLFEKFRMHAGSIRSRESSGSWLSCRWVMIIRGNRLC